jgi:malate dehydrogenase (oxaloacetate-decarboxylating)(NADP+)
MEMARQNPKRLVFAEANNLKVLKAAQAVLSEGIAQPVLLGNKDIIGKLIEDNCLRLDGITIINPLGEEEKERRERFAGFFIR